MQRINVAILTFLTLSSPVLATDYIVQDGETETTPITLPDDGDRAIVEEGGTLETAAVAINMNNDNQTALNQGTITTSTSFDYGVYNASNNNNVITNSGLISTVGTRSYGIYNNTDCLNTEITNSGQITTTGSYGYGIYNFERSHNAVITNSGQISASGTYGYGIVNNRSDDVVIINSGQITSSGIGIFNLNAADAVITSSGLISTSASSGYGIYNQNGDNAVITNSGQISTLGTNGHGMYNYSGSNNSVITNSGQISTSGTNAHAMVNNVGSNVVMTNSDQISTTGPTARGMLNLSGNNGVMTNSGQITTTGNDACGIENLSSTDVVITNSGQVTATGTDAYGIHNDSANLQIINSGTIRSTQSHAFYLTGANPNITLLRGSILQGTIVVPSSGLTLNVEKGLNLTLTLDSGNYDTLVISAPYVQVGSTIATIDPTGLAMQADVAADLSDTILDGIYRHRLGCCNPCGRGLWAQGLGSYRKRSHGNNTVGHDNWQGGFLLGYDKYFCGSNISLFGGASFAEAEVDEKTQRADINSYVLGLSYEYTFCNTFLGFAIAAGYVDWHNERFVRNNLVAGGVETAKANIDGVFVSPEATLAHQFASLPFYPILSFTLRYASLSLDRYHEKGSQTNFTVRDRDIELLTTRLEAAIPFSKGSREFCCWSIEPYVGLFGRYQVAGNRVNGRLLGQSLHFDQGNPKNSAAFFLGIREMLSFDCLTFCINLEASLDDENCPRILGEGGVTWNF